MREIKFRAWDLLSKSYIHLSDKLCSVPYYEIFNHTPDSRPWIVEQSTGLIDKNGKEIYEGDIVRTSLVFEGATLPHSGVITWDEENSFWATKNDAGLTATFKHSGLREIIGNIHENEDIIK